MPRKPPKRYTIQRRSGGQVVTELTGLSHKTACGIVLMVWGMVPVTLEEGGGKNETWNLHMGGAEFVLIARTA